MDSNTLDSSYYNFTQQLQGQLFQAMRVSQPEVMKELGKMPPLLQIRGGYAESPAWFMVQAAEFDPEPLTVANLRVRDIYASERIVTALLEMLAGERWLARDGENYELTAAGRDILAQLQSRTAKFLNPEQLPLPASDLTQLLALLGQLMDHSLASPNPTHSWCLDHSRRRAPKADAPPLMHFNQFLADINAFRDDAHMAAWQAENIEGYVWEAFSFVHSGQAKNGSEVYENLFFRGYSAKGYEKALQSLTTRGWLDQSSDHNYTVTSTGHEVHASIEAATDHYFYAPWGSLSPSDKVDLQQLLQAMSDELQRIGSG